MSERTRGGAAIFVLATAWGVISILVREVPLPALTLVFWRVALAALALGAVLATRAPAARRAAFRAPSRALVALGVALAFHWCCYFLAVRATSVASANLVTYANPILIALLAPALLGERIPRVTAIALAASILGIVLIGVLGPSRGSGAVRGGGLALAALAAASYAAIVLGLKRYAAAEDPLRIAFWQSAVAAVVLIPAAPLTLGHRLDALDWGYILLLGVVLTGASGWIFLRAIRAVPATSVGILAYMEPVSAAALAALLLGERSNGAVVAGGALIVAAGVAVIRARPADTAPPGPPIAAGRPRMRRART